MLTADMETSVITPTESNFGWSARPTPATLRSSRSRKVRLTRRGSPSPSSSIATAASGWRTEKVTASPPAPAHLPRALRRSSSEVLCLPRPDAATWLGLGLGLGLGFGFGLGLRLGLGFGLGLGLGLGVSLALTSSASCCAASESGWSSRSACWHG